MGLAGLAVAVGHSLDAGNTEMMGEIALAGLAQIPAAWVVTALAMVVFGWAPRFTGVSWALYVAFFVLVELGALLNLPSWLVGISPFVHSPKLPGTAAVLGPCAVMIAISCMLTAIGYAGWRRRDLAP
jgi:ABC-2 type transport system permease protein